MEKFGIFKQLLETYKSENGDLLVKERYVTDEGILLGKMVQNVRAGRIKLYEDERNILDSMGFVWNVHEYNFNKIYKLVLQYKMMFGHCKIPYYYKTKDGYQLGRRLCRIRCNPSSYSQEELNLLYDLGAL